MSTHSSRNPPDDPVWSAYVKTVTPLGQPKASTERPAPLAAFAPATGRSIDLHSLTLAEAHMVVMDFVEGTRKAHKSVTVVTGMSGAIRREFCLWFDRHPHVSRIEELPGGGAYRLHFRSPKRVSNPN